MKKLLLLLLFLSIISYGQDMRYLESLDDSGKILQFDISKGEYLFEFDDKNLLVPLDLFYSKDKLVDGKNCFYTDHSKRSMSRQVNRKKSLRPKLSSFYKRRFSMFEKRKGESLFYSTIAYHHKPELLLVKNGEIIGNKTYLWTTEIWNDFAKSVQGKSDTYLLLNINPHSVRLDKDQPMIPLKKMINDKKCIVINKDYFNRIVDCKNQLENKLFFDNSTLFVHLDTQHYKNLLIESSQPTEIIEGECIVAGNPIMLVDEKNHRNRADSEDWRIYAYMNGNNGDFFQYFFFETEIDQRWPLYIRDFAMDHLAGAHICKKSTVLINKKSHEKIFKQGHMRGNNPKDVYISKTKGKQWRPDPVPEDKNTISKDRLFFDEELGRIFGSYAKVWELDVWQMLPNMLRDNPEGVYLIGYGTLLQLNECKTPYEEQALLKKCGVLITPQIYKELQSLRRLEQSQSKISPQQHPQKK